MGGESVIPQKSALGKGLASLLPGAGAYMAPPAGPAAHEALNRDRHPGISLARPEEIQVNPFQPRRDFDENALDELAAFIKANGLIQPLVVRKGTGGYE